MFFNSFNKRMKSAYEVLDPNAKEIVFPNGEKEFVYVATLLKNNFSESELPRLFQIYGSIRSFVSMEKGNYHYIFDYSKRKMINYSDEQVYIMIGIAMSTMIPNNNYLDSSNELLNKCKEAIKSELKIINQINEHPDIFATKHRSDVGSFDNPVLLPGISGVQKYFDRMSTKDGKDIDYKRINCIYLTDKNTNISYALDEYEIYQKETNKLISTIYINEYGVSDCKYYPKGFKNKEAQANEDTEAEEQVYSYNDITSALMNLSIKECGKIADIMDKEGISYNYNKVYLSTFVYFSNLCLSFFHELTFRQYRELNVVIQDKYFNLISETMQDFTLREYNEIKNSFSSMMEETYCRINELRKSEKDFSTSLINEFLLTILSKEETKKISPLVEKVFDKWVKLAKELSNNAIILN